MTTDPTLASGAMDVDSFLKVRSRLDDAGLRLVFTNGCFDLLHVGHVRYLAAARTLGDRLVVAVNADETVERLKGPGRPINRLADRMEMLAALEAVDFVVPFAEETPAEVIRLLQPDVLVKGGDWPIEQIVGRDTVQQRGGVVRSLDYAPGYSTTGLIERICEVYGHACGG